jgi:hypothetical protein
MAAPESHHLEIEILAMNEEIIARNRRFQVPSAVQIRRPTPRPDQKHSLRRILPQRRIVIWDESVQFYTPLGNLYSRPIRCLRNRICFENEAACAQLIAV